jgi:hypothetical protein
MHRLLFTSHQPVDRVISLSTLTTCERGRRVVVEFIIAGVAGLPLLMPLRCAGGKREVLKELVAV